MKWWIGGGNKILKHKNLTILLSDLKKMCYFLYFDKKYFDIFI